MLVVKGKVAHLATEEALTVPNSNQSLVALIL